MTVPRQMIMRVGDKLIELQLPAVMGIVNVTPDSFYAGSRATHIADVLRFTERMIGEGASIIDVGAMSSRPGAEELSPEEELNRLLLPIREISKEFPDVLISADTYRSEVLRGVAQEGIHMVNDISGGILDESFLDCVADCKLPYILMHMKGTPQTMQKEAKYDNLMVELLSFFADRIHECRKRGINDIFLDPGFGFGKTIAHNFTLLRRLESCTIFDLPILVGISRKSFIYKTLDTNPENALNGTTAMHMMALQNGASILRVHDVAEAVQCIKLWGKY